jgi:hypothetical protein
MGEALVNAVLGTFQVIVISSERSRSTYFVQLDSAPMVGETLALPHGEVVLVRHVGPPRGDGLAGVIIAGSP